MWNKHMGGETGEKNRKRLCALGDLAKELGYTQAQLAIAWVLANKDVSTCIMGFSKPE
jgi:aryl-alcohol dehydrogenase-like predicted oxidoreductase